MGSTGYDEFMARPILRFGFLLSIMTLSGCEMFVGHNAAARRVTKEQLEKIHPGMTIEQVRDVLGRPWQIVVDGVGASREVHQYRMDGERYQEFVKTYDVEFDVYVTESIILTQLRIVELTFENGELLEGSR